MFDYSSDWCSLKEVSCFIFSVSAIRNGIMWILCPMGHDQMSRVGMSLHQGAFISMAADIPSEANARSAWVRETQLHHKDCWLGSYEQSDGSSGAPAITHWMTSWHVKDTMHLLSQSLVQLIQCTKNVNLIHVCPLRFVSQMDFEYNKIYTHINNK